MNSSSPHQLHVDGLAVDLAQVTIETREALECLWERGDAGVERSGDTLRLSHDVTWGLTDDILMSLDVQRMSSSVRVVESGLPGRSRYAWSLAWPPSTQVDGCWLIGTDGRQILPPEVVQLHRLKDRVRGASKVTTFRAMIRLQALARTCSLIELPQRIAESRIREACEVRVEVSGPPEDPHPVPRLVAAAEDPQPPESLLKGATEQETANTSSSADWRPANEIVTDPEIIDIPLETLVDDIVGRAADDSVIPVGRRDFLVLPKGVFQNVVLTAAAAEQPAEVRERFVENPMAFLPDPDSFDEAHYSARVVGVGEPPRPVANEQVTSRTWAEPVDGLLIDGPSGPVWVPGESLPQLASELRAAIDARRESVIWEGREIPAWPDVARAVGRAAAPREPGPEGGDEEPARPQVLRIRQNEVVLDWAPVRGGGRRAPRPALPELADDVHLQPHQETALARFQDLWVRGEPGALLCDDMGLGKTLQALVLAAWVHRQLQFGGGSRTGDPVTLPVMIVGPPSLLEGWLRELGTRLSPGILNRVIWGSSSLPGEAHGRDIRLLKHFRRDRKPTTTSKVVVEHARLDMEKLSAFEPDVMLIGYDTLRSLQFAVGELRVGIIVADEVQNVKNPGSLRSHALRAMNYDFALALTGTPIENSWTDLWTVCDFATPGLLGTLADFRREYPSSGDIRAVGEGLAGALNEVLVRRTRGSALRGLPPCQVRSFEQPMPDIQALAYRAEVARYSGGKQAILGLLQGLARISLHPRIRALFTSKSDARTWLEESARTAVLLMCLERWQLDSGPVLVFVRSLAAQETLARAISLVFDLPVVEILNGKSPFSERQRIVQRFERGSGFRVLLVSPDVGGAGWNLQFAARSVLLERPFNPALEAQMIARTWRLGQTRPVEVASPVAVLDDTETFDVVLDRLLADKRELAESVLAPAVVQNEEIAARFGGILGGLRPAEA